MCRWAWLCALLLSPLLLAGCARNPSPAGAGKPPEVLVGTSVVREVTDYEVFTGRTESSRRADLRASRVTGYLIETHFTEGALVKEGDPLFLIDPRRYKAELARAEASLKQARVYLARMERDYERGQNLYARQAMSREELDKIVGDRDEAKAAVGVAESDVELARLNVEFTEVRAPFAGRIGRQLVDPGNMVKGDETILATLVAPEPMFAYFDVDERTVLGQMAKERRAGSARKDPVPVQIGLSDEEGFPHAGVINFVDNRVDPNTGSKWMRAEFVNPALPAIGTSTAGLLGSPPGSGPFLAASALIAGTIVNPNPAIEPGIFVRVRFPVGKPYRAVLVAEQALGSDQGQKFLYVIDEQNRANYRPVKVGRLHDGLRVIQDGLKPGERIVVSGLQRVRDRAEITPKAQTRTDDGTPSTVQPLRAGARSTEPATPERATETGQ